MQHTVSVQKGRTNSLTSSISSRETLLLSLLDMETEPESATGASTGLFCWSLWESCETWVECCISDVLCESCITSSSQHSQTRKVRRLGHSAFGTRWWERLLLCFVGVTEIGTLPHFCSLFSLTSFLLP